MNHYRSLMRSKTTFYPEVVTRKKEMELGKTPGALHHSNFYSMLIISQDGKISVILTEEVLKDHKFDWVKKSHGHHSITYPSSSEIK